jgi:hypothetical protein
LNFYIVGDDLYPEDPDIFGDHPPLIIEGTIKELNEKHKNLNRYIVTKSVCSLGTIKCIKIEL